MLKTLRKNCRAVMLVCLSLCIWASCAAAQSETGHPAAAAAPGQEWEGFVSQQKEEFIKVVTTPEEWTALWKRAFDQPSPPVDFERHAVACVFLGYSTKWLFSIVFEEAQVRGDTLVIPYGLFEMILELSGPFKAGGQYAMKVFEKRGGADMILEESPFSPSSIRSK